MDMRAEGGWLLPTEIRPAPDLGQLTGDEVVGALTQIGREHASATGALVLTWGREGDQLGHRAMVAEELRNLVQRSQLPAGARREDAMEGAQASGEGGTETRKVRPTVQAGGRAEPSRAGHEPPPLPRRPGYESVVFLDEVTRVVRARHAFGVLGDVVVYAVPSRGGGSNDCTARLHGPARPHGLEEGAGWEAALYRRADGRGDGTAPRRGSCQEGHEAARRDSCRQQTG